MISQSTTRSFTLLFDDDPTSTIQISPFLSVQSTLWRTVTGVLISNCRSMCTSFLPLSQSIIIHETGLRPIFESVSITILCTIDINHHMTIIDRGGVTEFRKRPLSRTWRQSLLTSCMRDRKLRTWDLRRDLPTLLVSFSVDEYDIYVHLPRNKNVCGTNLTMEWDKGPSVSCQPNGSISKTSGNLVITISLSLYFLVANELCPTRKNDYQLSFRQRGRPCPKSHHAVR